jgi:hypothetical protein
MSLFFGFLLRSLPQASPFIGFFLVFTLFKALVPLSNNYRNYLCNNQLANLHENQGFNVPDYASTPDKKRSQWSQDYANVQNQVNAFSRYQRCMKAHHFEARMRLFRWIPFAENVPSSGHSDNVGTIKHQKHKRTVYRPPE